MPHFRKLRFVWDKFLWSPWRGKLSSHRHSSSLQVSSIIPAPSVHNIYIQSFRQRSDRKAETDIGAASSRSERARRDFLRLQKSNQSLKLRWPNGRYIDTHWVTQQFMAFLKDQLCYEMSFLGNTITTN